jgi:hypothetical protein
VRLFLPAGRVDWFLDHQPEIMPGHAILRFSASCSLIWPVCLSRVSSWPGSRCGSGPLLRARRWLARRVGWPRSGCIAAMSGGCWTPRLLARRPWSSCESAGSSAATLPTPRRRSPSRCLG